MTKPQRVNKQVGQTQTETGGPPPHRRVIVNCAKHGKSEVRIIKGLDIKPECPICKEQSKPVNIIPMHHISEQINRNRCGYPKRFAGANFDSFKVSSKEQNYALCTARGYALNFKKDAKNSGACLSFMGTVGTGKTHLACAIGNAVMNSGFSVVYTTARQAVNAIKETWRRDSEFSESQILQRFIKPDLLIFDEVGVQFNTDAEKVLMFDIFDGRYGGMLPSVVVSNLALDGLKSYMGERSVDRLRENGGMMVDFRWNSFRI